MCGKKPAAPPPVVQRDPVAEQAAADATATREANAETATRRRRRASSGSGMGAVAIRAANLGQPGAAAAPSLLAQARPGG